MGKVKVRLMGEAHEVTALSQLLNSMLTVVEESADYGCRGSATDVRRYITIEMPDYPTEPLIEQTDLEGLLPVLASEKR